MSYRDTLVTIDPSWIVFEDEDLVVVDKPAYVPSQASDEGKRDDIVTRLTTYLEARDGKKPYVGTHQRLDKDTSGLLVFAARKEANKGLAAAFEGRKVVKGYVAGVMGWSGPSNERTLRDRLAPGDDGIMTVVSPKDCRTKAQEAVTHVRVRERVGDRTLLELALETGRTHQARVQLAHAHAPIVGDALYGGSRGPRLLLHAERLEFAHPRTGKTVSFVAKVPPEFSTWLARGDLGEAIYADGPALTRALRLAAERRYSLAHASDRTTAFRLVNEAGDALPNVAIDVYDEWAVVQFYGSREEFGAGEKAVLDAVHAMGFRGVYAKYRPKQANVIIDSRREEFAPKDPVRGEPAPEPLVIREEGVELPVRLGDGLSTGIFLDQRENRRRVRELAKGASVANLFSYTCGFSVVAADGGAWKTVSVDASDAVLARGREAMERSGLLERGDHKFVCEDAFVWLAKTKSKGKSAFVDLLILDPPSYSTTKATRFSSDGDYVELAAMALEVIRPGGRLLACSNHRGIVHAKFRRFLREAATRAKIELAQLKDMPAPVDFPVPPGESSHLKAVLATLAKG